MKKTIIIDLWFWTLQAPPADIARWRGYLDEAESIRMQRFMFERDRLRFTICRSRLRRILGFYTSTPPRDVRFAVTGREKPVIAAPNNTGIHFNLSHTDGLACLAVSRERAVGVDVEQFRDVTEEFMEYALNPAEFERLRSLASGADRVKGFFWFWTAKEAYLKAIGTGLWQSLKSFDVDVDFDVEIGRAPLKFIPGRLTRIDDAQERALNWHLYTFKATSSHVGAFAVATDAGQSVEFRTRWIGEQPL